MPQLMWLPILMSPKMHNEMDNCLFCQNVQVLCNLRYIWVEVVCFCPRFKQKPPLPWSTITTSVGVLVIFLLVGHIFHAALNRIAKVEDDYREMMELKTRAEAADVAKSQVLHMFLSMPTETYVFHHKLCLTSQIAISFNMFVSF